MRLGIKGKQVLGVTSIVGAVVVRAEPAVPGRAGARQPRREPGARRAPRQRHLSSRARSGGRAAPIRTRRCATIPGCGRFSSRACTPRTSRSRRSSTSTASPSRTPIRRSKARRCRPAAISRELVVALRRSSQLVAIYTGQGRNLEFSEPLLLGDTDFGSIRIGVSTLLVRAGSRRVARPGGRDRRRARSAWRCSARCCSRSCCSGRSTSSAAA